MCLPGEHPLASHDHVTASDLAQETVLDAHARRTAKVEEKLELVAAGAGLAVLPVSVARYYARADVVHRPLPDTERARICLVAAADRSSQQVSDVVTVARAVLVDAFPDHAQHEVA